MIILPETGGRGDKGSVNYIFLGRILFKVIKLYTNNKNCQPKSQNKNNKDI